MTTQVCEGVAGVEIWDALVPNSKPYRDIHDDVREERGLAVLYDCIQCGDTAVHWAWQRGENPRLIESYEPMCRSCHWMYDGIGRNGFQLGHTINQGEKQWMAKLTEADVLEIRAIHAAGEMGYVRLGQLFGVGHMTIADVVKRRTWRHI